MIMALSFVRAISRASRSANGAGAFSKHMVGLRQVSILRHTRRTHFFRAVARTPEVYFTCGNEKSRQRMSFDNTNFEYGVFQVRKSSSGKESHKLEESKMEKQTIWTIPNILTLSRISCTPVLCALVYGGQYKYAFIGLCIAGFSDWLDGFLARHLNQQTVFGSLIDPVADKILITSLALTEGYCELLPAQLVALILLRDAGLVLGGFWYRYKTKPPNVKFFDTTHKGVIKVEPSMLSKVNTVGQIALLTFAITNAGYGAPSSFYIDALTWTVGLTTFGSGLDYLRMKNLVLAPKNERK